MIGRLVVLGQIVVIRALVMLGLGVFCLCLRCKSKNYIFENTIYGERTDFKGELTVLTCESILSYLF